jgi:hypothetical protein
MKIFTKNTASSLLEFFLVKEEDMRLEHTIHGIRIGEQEIIDDNTYDQYYITGIVISTKDIYKHSFRFQKLRNSKFSFGSELEFCKEIKQLLLKTINKYLENQSMDTETEDELIDYLIELSE